MIALAVTRVAHAAAVGPAVPGKLPTSVPQDKQGPAPRTVSAASQACPQHAPSPHFHVQCQGSIGVFGPVGSANTANIASARFKKPLRPTHRSHRHFAVRSIKMFSKKGPVSLSTLSPLSRGLQQQHEQRQQPTLMPMLQPRPLANAQQGFTSVQSFGSASVVAPSQSQRQHTLFVPDAAQASNTQPQPLPLPPQHQPAHPSCHTPQDSHYLQPACNAGIQHPQYQHHPVGEGVPPGPLPLPKPTTSSSPATVAPGTWSAGIKTADSRHSSHAANVNTLTPAASAAPAGPPTPRQQAPSAPQHSFPSPHSLPLPHPPAPNTPPQQHDQAQPVPPVLEPSHPTPSSIPSVGRLPPSPPSFCSPAPATALPTSSACQPSTSPMSFPAEPTPAQYVYVTRASRAPEPAVPSVRSSAAPGPLEQEQQDPDHVGVLLCNCTPP